MKDRIVEHPNRYRLVAVPGEAGVFDLVPEPGVITEAGTAMNKANLLTDETASLFGLAGNPTVNEALNTIGSANAPFNAYTTDFWLYITGQHPILNATDFSREDYGQYMRPARQIAISGNPETITIYDKYSL